MNKMTDPGLPVISSINYHETKQVKYIDPNIQPQAKAVNF